MKNKFAQALALLATVCWQASLLWDLRHRARILRSPHRSCILKYRVALMDHNAVYVQLLTVVCYPDASMVSLCLQTFRFIRMYALLAAVAALLSILTTRFGNVPINRIMRMWEASEAPGNWRETLHQWDLFN